MYYLLEKLTEIDFSPKVFLHRRILAIHFVIYNDNVVFTLNCIIDDVDRKCCQLLVHLDIHSGSVLH